MIDIVGKRKWFFIFSGLLMVPGLVFLLLGGLKLGIDFTGGTIWELQFTRPTASLDVKAVLAANGLDAQVRARRDSPQALRTSQASSTLQDRPRSRRSLSFSAIHYSAGLSLSLS